MICFIALAVWIWIYPSTPVEFFQFHTNLVHLLYIFVLGIADGNKYKGGIYMVFEYMDHDLTGLADRPGMRFTVPQIKVLLMILIDISYFIYLIIVHFNVVWVVFPVRSVTWDSFWRGCTIVMWTKYFIVISKVCVLTGLCF